MLFSLLIVILLYYFSFFCFNLRFRGFDDEWETKMLKDVSTINPKTKDLPNEFVYIDLDSVENGILTKKNKICIEDAPSRAQRLLDVNDILFQTVRPYQMNNLYFDYDDDNYVASTGYAQIKSKINSRYLYHYLHYSKFVNEVLKRCTGTSYPAINANDLKKIKIKIPSDLDEQMFIGSIFDRIDEKIELLEKKHQYYQYFKKFLMQQIFAQKLRFDYDDEWKVIKLKSILKERKEYTDNLEVYPHVTLSKDGIYLKNERYNREFLVKDKNKKYKVTHIGDICYNPANLKFGVITLNKFGSAIFSPIYVTFEVSGADKEYISYFLTRPDFINKVRRYEEGTVYERMAVKPSDFLNEEIQLPSFKEQKQISSLLKSIDNKIYNIGYKCEKVNLFKKGLLQQMFV